jgi:hypothetical protein
MAKPQAVEPQSRFVGVAVNATNVTPDKLGLHKKAVPGHDWESL